MKGQLSTGRRLAVILSCITAVFSLFALPASADVTSVGGGAFGASVTSSLLGTVLPPTPSVTLPPGGGGPFTATALPVEIPGVLGVHVLNARTQGGNLGTHQGFAQSSADVAQVTVGGLPPAVPPNLTIDAIHSECLSNGDGSSGLTRILGVTGTTIPVLPAPNSAVPQAQLPPGIAEIRLNEQIIENRPGFTSITVNAVRITLLPNPVTGAVLEIILAQSRCSAAGPDVNTGQVAIIKQAPADAQNQQFTFTITCPGMEGSPFTRTVTGSGTTEPVINVPAGTVCTASEAPVEGFVNQPNQTFPAVASGATSTVTFVNQRTPAQTGAVAVIKNAPADAQNVQFTFTITCPGVAGSPFTRTVTGSGTSAPVTGLPVGTVCTVSEAPVAGFVNQPNQTFPAVTAGTTQTVTFFNTRVGDQAGAVAVVKQAPADAQNVTFTFTISCPGVAGSPFTRTVTGSGTTAAVTGIPAGTVCTVAEAPVAGFVNQPNQTFPAVTAGTTRTVTFVNTRTAAVPAPAIVVQKAVNPITRPQPGGIFSFTVQVTNTGSVPVVITSIVDDVHGNLDDRGTCQIGATLAASPGPGNTYTCSFSVQFTGNSGASETDRVTVTATDAAGRTVTATSNAVTISITPPGTQVGGPTIIINNDNRVTCTSNATSASAAGQYRIAQVVNIDNNNSAECRSSATSGGSGTGSTPAPPTAPAAPSHPAPPSGGRVLARTGADALPLAAFALALMVGGWALLSKRPAGRPADES